MNANIDKKETRGMSVIPASERKCIWMQAGSVSYKLCTNQYQCNKCEYDQAMSNRAQRDKEKTEDPTQIIRAKKPVIEWMEEFKNFPANQRKCRYMLMGEVKHKICPNSFRCGKCSFDQMMQDREQPIVRRVEENYEKVAGFFVPKDNYYFRNHVWLSLDRTGKFRIGIDDFARRLLGKVTGVDLPNIGKEVDFEEYTITIHHEYGDVELVSPVKGIVESVNHCIAEDPAAVTEDPYNDGWLLTIDPTSVRKSMKNLMKDKATEAWMTDEVNQLTQELQAEAGATLQDGANVSKDLSQNLPKDKWREVVKKHLFSK